MRLIAAENGGLVRGNRHGFWNDINKKCLIATITGALSLVTPDESSQRDERYLLTRWRFSRLDFSSMSGVRQRKIRYPVGPIPGGHLETPIQPCGPSQKTIKRLFSVSGNQCAFPSCPTKLVLDATIIGEICHIRSPKPNGPRHDPRLSPEECHAFENLILMCANHHKVIDDNEDAYAVERLEKIKVDHESLAQRLPDAQVNAIALILSSAQSASITAQTVTAGSIHFHSPAPLANYDLSLARAAAAREFLSPELARILTQQLFIFDRAIVNFLCASTESLAPGDHWTTFLPSNPSLYPTATEIRDLPKEDATLLAEFYDSLHGIENMVSRWHDAETLWDMNMWNVLMQSAGDNVKMGVKAVERFCPTRQYSPLMPASGSLIERARVSMNIMQRTMAAHLERWTKKMAPPPPTTPAGPMRRRT